MSFFHRNSIHYLGNKKLRRSDVDLPMSPFQIEEVIKCSLDFYYFQENYINIISADHGLIKFKPRPYQKRFLDAIHKEKFVISMQPRQVGKSLSVSAYICWFSIFHPYKRSAILANTEKMAKANLADIKTMYENIPMWMQQGVKEWNKKSVELENGSTFFCEATTENSLRGDTVNLVFLDEFAHISSTIIDGFFASVYPTISSAEKTKIVIVSTPKGMNHFYKMWEDAKNGRNKYKHVLVENKEVPKRDAKWEEETIANIGELRFAQEYSCSFIGSSGTLLNAQTIRNFVVKDPIQSSNNLDIYENPLKDHEYVCTVDVAHGKGLDYTVISVIDTTKIPYKYVAKYRSNTISPLSVPEMIFNVARTYNDAFVLIEINDLGFSVAESLYHELEYENIFSVKLQGRTGQVLSYNINSKYTKGLKTTPATKKIGCSNLKALMENGKLLVNDYDAIKEFSTFIHKPNARGGTYQADDGEHDDVVMSLVIFGWLVNDKIFSEMSDSNIRKDILDVDIEHIEETLLPVGIFNTNDTFGKKSDDVEFGGEIWY